MKHSHACSTRFDDIVNACQKPRTVEQIVEAIGGDLKRTRYAVYNLVRLKRLKNLNAGVYKNTKEGGLFIASELAGEICVHVPLRPPFDASALVAAWGRA